MFEVLPRMAPDALLGLIVAHRNDTNPKKVDLGVGIFKDEEGNTPVLSSVKKAEKIIWQTEETKSYIPPGGTPSFIAALTNLVLGADHKVIKESRVRTIQSPGGCGALRAAAEIINKANPDAVVWASNPTWANHVPLLSGAGLTMKEYAYYDYDSHSLSFGAMMNDLKAAKEGDVVLLHGCCHNPSGADLSDVQWEALVPMLKEKKLIPLIDVAYQGFGRGIEEDAYGLRLMAANLDEVIITVSGSKNFGLYRERTGAVMYIAADAKTAEIIGSQAEKIIRGIWSVPPSHGAAIVDVILNNPELKSEWEGEVAYMRRRITDMRALFVKVTAEQDMDFSFINDEYGMFSFLGITPEQVEILASKYAIYMAGSSRISIAGINPKNVEYLVASLKSVIRSS